MTVDKEGLYGEYLAGSRWRNSLAKKLAHKALDINPEDDVNVVNNRVGFGWKELAVLAMAGLGAGGIYTMNQSQSQPAQIQQGVSPLDSEYVVRFYDKDGNLIEVPHISQRQTKD